ncbi:MAG: HYR domain-containing protein [Chitinophagales bacterium]|nr:HYR domain-containing protein [Chitinophagales bacterium]
MRKKITLTLLSILTCCVVNTVVAQCIGTFQFPSGTVTPSLPGTTEITTCTWPGDYTVITLTAGYTYTFSSTVSTDYITVTNGANSPLATGTGSVTYTPSATADYRVHWHVNSSCVTENVCRTTSVTAFATCIATSLFPSALQTPTNPGTKQISTCNYAGEYYRITLTVGYVYTFTSSVTTDYITITTDANAPLTGGTQGSFQFAPTTTGVYRVHIHTGSACGTQSTCRTTNVISALQVLVPFAGNNAISCGSPATLQDHAGTGNYANNANGYTVLNAAASAVVNINGNYSTESGWDFINIYDGAGTGGTLLATYTGAGVIAYAGTPGQTLTIQFTSDNTVVGQGFSLNITYTGSCYSDNVCDAFPLNYGTNGTYSNVGATVQVGEPAPPATGCQTQTGWCNSTLHNSLWFTFVAPASGHVILQSTGYDTQLAIWDAADCNAVLSGGATLVAANDDDAAYVAHGGNQFSSYIDRTCLTPGQMYFVQVDGFSATSTGNLTINLTDAGNAAPTVANCPANINQNTDAGNCDAVVTWTAPTFTDPEGGTVNVTSSHTSGSLFPLGTTTVTITGEDCMGLTVSCSFDVTVTDNEAPVITCAGPETFVLAAGECTVPSNSCISQSGFEGSFAPANWTLTNTGDGNGSVDISNAPVSVTLTGSDGATGSTYTNYETTVGCAGTIIFSWDYSTADWSAQYDPFGYTLNGNFVVLTNPSSITESGTTAVAVQAGDVFAFTINSTDNAFGASASIISNFIAGPITVSDNCGIASVTNNAPSSFPVGTTTITWTATDVNGNTATCTQDITVVDSENPVITCNGPITLNTDAGQCGAANNFCSTTQAGFAGPFAPANWTLTNTNGGNGSVDASNAPTSVTLTGSDGSGNGQSFTHYQITIPCAGTLSFNWDYSTTDWSAQYDPFGYTLNGNFVELTDPSSITESGSTTVSVQGGDVFAFTINSTDNAFGASASIVSSFVANATFTATATDNCGIASVTNDAPATFPVGTTTVTWTATDVNGNTATCTQDVTVVDNEAPVAVCQDITISLDGSGNASITAAQIDGGSTDNCGIASVTVSSDAFDCGDVGANTVTLTVTDVNGNTSICTATVTVEDNEDPTITCPADVTVNADAGSCDATGVALGAPATADNCGIASVTNDAPATFPVGTTTVTWTVTDDNGNTATCTQDVIVEDNENPTITCPVDVTVPADAGLCTASGVALGTPITGDNCGVASVTNNAPAIFSLGATTVTWTVTDNSGNIATCTQTVTVTGSATVTIDNCPGDVSVNNNAGTCGATVTYAAITASGGCGTVTITQTSGLASGSTFPIGTTTNTFIAVDGAGNADTCSFDVTVTDTELPVLQTCNGGTFTIAITPLNGWIDETSWTLTDVNGNVVGSGGPYGNVPVTATVVASSGGPFTFNVETQGLFNDNDISYTISCGGNVIVSATQAGGTTGSQTGICCGYTPGCTANIATSATNSCNVVVNYPAPTASDNCPGVTVTQTSGLPSGSAFPVGVTTNTFVATDASGNTTTCSFTVTVTDPVAPVFTPQSCNGGTFTISLTPLNTFIDETTWTLTDGNGNIVGSGGPYGTQPVTETVIAVGNGPFTFNIETQGAFNDNDVSWTITCSGSVVASGTTAGGTTGSQANICCGGNACPDDVAVNVDAGDCGAIVTYTTPTATDNCGTPTVTQTAGLASGSVFPVGTTTNTFVATDASGNTATCSFTVTVTDNEAPSIACPADVAVNADAGACSATGVALGNPVTADNCGVDTITNNAPATFPVGATTVTWTVIDVNGNSATCTQTVTVLDAEAPIVTCPSDITSCDPVVTFAATATDNCGIDTIIYSHASGSTFPVGTTLVTVTATDVNGNTSTCTFEVNISTPPTVNLGNDVVQCGGSVTLDAGNSGATYAWSDNSNNQTLSVTASGEYSVTVTSQAGCSAADTVNVTINTPPTVNLGPDATHCAGGSVTLDAGNAGATYTWSNNATSQTITVSASGTYSVTVTDANGCTASDAISLTFGNAPTVNLGPDVTQCGNTVTLNAGNAGATFVWSTTQTTQTITVTISGTYSVTVTNSSGCSAADTVNITINALPQVTFSLPADTFCTTDASFTLTGGLPAGGTYSGSGVSGGVFSPSTGAGSYVITYSYTDANGCSNSATDNIFVKVCVGMSDIAEGMVKLYPNPATDYVELNIEGLKGQLTVQVFDMVGQLVQSLNGNVETDTYKQVMDVSNLSSANYLVRVVVGDKLTTFNMIVRQR